MRAEIRAGKWKRANCKRCAYFAFASGELVNRKQLRKRKDLKRNPCTRCPVRGFLKSKRG